MLIKSIEIKNFRSISNQCLDCDNITLLVGRNGSGKSSFLYAIETFYDIDARISQEDFFNHDITSPIEIRVTYCDLRDDEKKEFRPYIKDEKLIVTKRIYFENSRFIQRYYGAALQIPKFAEIRAKSGKRDRINAWNELVESAKLADLGGKEKSADEVDRLIVEYEASRPEFMEAIEREEQFFGPRNIGGGKLDKFTKYVLVPAVREATDEAAGKKGAIYQLLDMIVLRKVNARRDIQEFRVELERKARELYSSENLRELSELGVSISQTLTKFAPGSQLNLKWDEVKPPELQLPAARATLIEDNFEGEISRKGHGLQRALILTLLQHLAMAVPEKVSAEELAEGSVGKEGQFIEVMRGPDLILGIEEPELYLHPSRCRYLFNVLLELVDNPGIGLGASNQIIYATHSPYFIDLSCFQNIRVVRKKPCFDSPIPQTVVKSFSLEEAATKLAEVCDVDPNRFTKESFKAHAMSVMNIIVNEGFFADTVVIVEGQTEMGSLWRIQEILNKNWDKLGIVIVPANNKNNIDRPTIIFRGFDIQTYFIFDGDIRLKGKPRDEKEEIKRNHCLLRLAGVAVEDFPDTQIHPTWAVFSDKIEKSWEEELGKEYFVEIRNKIASELGYDEPDRVLKNIDGAVKFVDYVYDDKKHLQTLEKIVETVTELGEASRCKVEKIN
ncbi:MAG: AAA family ATPase [Thermodesulfobacteriota bacterium]